MILRVFSIRDDKVAAYAQPWYAPTRGAALRMFADLVNDDQSAVAKHPEDYTLFELGSYDDATGQFVCEDSPYALGKALEYANTQSSVVPLSVVK